MTFEAVIGQDTSQIRVTDEEDSVHVPDFTLVPVSRSEHGGCGGNGVDLIGVSLDTNTCVVLDGEEVIDDLETLRAGGVIGSADVHACAELGLSVVAEEGQGGNDGVGCDVKSELVLDDAELLNKLGKACQSNQRLNYRFEGRCERAVRVEEDKKSGQYAIRAENRGKVRPCVPTRSDVAAKVVQGSSNVLVLVYWIGAGGLTEGADRVDTVTLAISLNGRSGGGLGNG